MSSFLYRLGRACYRHKLRVFGIWLLVAVVLGGGAAVIGGNYSAAFGIPGAPSEEALHQLNMAFPGSGNPTATVIIEAPAGESMTDADVKATVEDWLGDMEHAHLVDSVTSPYSPYVNGLISDDESAARVMLSIDSTLGDFSEEDGEKLTADAKTLTTMLPGSVVTVGGDVFSVSIPSLSITEVFGVVVAFVVLILTLGSLVAAGFPLAVALTGAGIGMTIIIIGTRFTDVNSATPMLSVMLGVAVGIDYSLFIISRHRDQLRDRSLSPEESAARAVAMAGSAVVFAGATVVIALVGMFVANIPFLTVMGMFAAVTVAIAVMLANTLLPALMGVAGERLRPRVKRSEDGMHKPAFAERVADRWVRLVTALPFVTILIVIVALGAMAIPAKDMHLALPGAGTNPKGTQSRTTYDLISKYFGPGANGPLVITGSIVESDDPVQLVDDIKAEVEDIPGVASVPVATPNQNADSMMIQVVPESGPTDKATTQLVEDIRSHQKEWKDRYGVETYVTGVTAVQIDVSDRLGEALFPFGLFVVGLSLVLLTIVFRSIWVPIKAALGYLLSIGAAFGLTTMVFNYGWGASLVNLEEPIPVISFFPIILMGILFGLAMDYEVFLVSRMREEFIHGDRNSVHDGFVHTAKVVAAAAVIMFSVFAFFVPEGDATIKPIAFGLAVGVAIDAFIVRMTLVPAVMALLGDRAWGLPRALDRALPTMDIEGEGLAHQLKVDAWDAAAPYAAYGEGLRLVLNGTRLFDNVHLALVPGQPLVITGPPQSRRALLLALTGRMDLTAGELQVLGHALPEEGAYVRKHAELILSDQEDFSRALAQSRATLIAVDGVSKLNATEFANLGVAIHNRPDIVWVLGTAPGSDLTALPPAHYSQVNLPLDRALARASR